MRPFGETQSKVTRVYAQSGKYHTIVESHVRLTVSNVVCIYAESDNSMI